MDFKQIKKLGDLNDHELTSKLVKLFHQISEAHYEFKGFSSFSWRNLEMTNEGDLRIVGVDKEPLTSEIKEQNYHDYAAIIYCICTKRKSDEFMTWDAGRKIKPVVLREIVLTLCGRNHSIEPLLIKLNKRYIDEETFLEGYSTVDEKEATDAFNREQTAKRNNYIQEEEFRREQEERKRNRAKVRILGISGSTLATLLAIGIIRFCTHSGSSYNVGMQNNVHENTPSISLREQINIQRTVQRVNRLSDSLRLKVPKIGIVDSTRLRLLNELTRLKTLRQEWLTFDDASQLRVAMTEDSIALADIEAEISTLSEPVVEPDSVADIDNTSKDN